MTGLDNRHGIIMSWLTCHFQMIQSWLLLSQVLLEITMLSSSMLPKAVRPRLTEEIEQLHKSLDRLSLCCSTCLSENKGTTEDFLFAGGKHFTTMATRQKHTSEDAEGHNHLGVSRCMRHTILQYCFAMGRGVSDIGATN